MLKVQIIGQVYMRFHNLRKDTYGVECRIRCVDEKGNVKDGRVTVINKRLYEMAKPTESPTYNSAHTFERENVEYFSLPNVDLEHVSIVDYGTFKILEDNRTLIRIGYVRLFGDNGSNSNTSGPKKPEHDM